VVVDVADDHLGGFSVVAVEFPGLELVEEVLLERFGAGDGVEEELAALFVFGGAALERPALGHVIAPFLVEFGEAIEFLAEIVGGISGGIAGGIGGGGVGVGLDGDLFEDRVGGELLLDELSELEGGGLEDLEALLELGRERVLERQLLDLMHPLGHNYATKRVIPPGGCPYKQFSRHRERILLNSERPMKNLKLWVVAAVAFGAGFCLRPTSAQSQAAPAASGAMGQLLAEVAAQRKVLEENQRLIDEKLGVLGEDLRVAKIYVSRTGGGR
jgi:hypothetical protein